MKIRQKVVILKKNSAAGNTGQIVDIVHLGVPLYFVRAGGPGRYYEASELQAVQRELEGK